MSDNEEKCIENHFTLLGHQAGQIFFHDKDIITPAIVNTSIMVSVEAAQ